MATLEKFGEAESAPLVCTHERSLSSHVAGAVGVYSLQVWEFDPVFYLCVYYLLSGAWSVVGESLKVSDP